MKIGIVYFTYGGDAEFLGLSLAGLEMLRKQTGDEVEVFVFDDAAAPLAVVPEGVVYEQTSFAREGNLNGVACVDGMLEAYAKAFERGADWVIKIDSDVVLNDVDWLRGYELQAVAEVGCRHVNDFCSGACYALTRVGMEAVREALTDANTRRRANIGWVEDRIVGRLCSMSGLRVVYLGGVYNVPHEGLLYHDWMNEGMAPIEELVRPYAVHFKRCRWNTTPEEAENDRAKALERMRAYVEYLKQEKETSDEQEG